MTLSEAFFLGPITLLQLFLQGSPLTIESFPLYVAGGLGTVFWITLLGVIGRLLLGR